MNRDELKKLLGQSDEGPKEPKKPEKSEGAPKKPGEAVKKSEDALQKSGITLDQLFIGALDAKVNSSLERALNFANEVESLKGIIEKDKNPEVYAKLEAKAERIKNLLYRAGAIKGQIFLKLESNLKIKEDALEKDIVAQEEELKNLNNKKAA